MQNIVKMLYVYAEAVKFSELKISEITSVGFSGIIQQMLVVRSPGLPGLFRCPCITRVVRIIDMTPNFLTNLLKKRVIGRGDSVLLLFMACQTY